MTEGSGSGLFSVAPIIGLLVRCFLLRGNEAHVNTAILTGKLASCSINACNGWPSKEVIQNLILCILPGQ